jgi:hypothetical protein
MLDRFFKREDPTFSPHMPEVDTLTHPDSVFVDARNVGLGYKRPPGANHGERYIALVTPGRLVMQLACPRPGERPISVVTEIRERFPVEPPGFVVAIALNELKAVREIKGAQRAIPFLNYLLDLGYAGHAVTIFEGHRSALRHGLTGAGLLVVDAGMIPFLQADWQDVAREVMAAPRLEIRHRDGRIEMLDLSTTP